MTRERDGDTGQYTTTTTDAEILEYLREAGGAGTAEVADEFDYQQSTAYRRLCGLEDDGRVTRREVGPALFWRPTERSGTEDAGNAPDHESTEFNREAWHDRLADRVRGSGDVADRRADAILELYDHLREHGEAETPTLRDRLAAEDVDFVDDPTAWQNMVDDENTLGALPGVEPPAPGTNDPWRYTGDSDE